jgi:hypothetical protein
MTTAKKSSDGEKHKSPAKKTAAAKASSGPQAFDIIPRSQVRPQATSKPVITANQPEVADDTIKQPSTAPALNLSKHKVIGIKPSDGLEAAKIFPAAAGQGAAANAEKGVSVSELIAKRSAKGEDAEVEPTEEAPAEDLPTEDSKEEKPEVKSESESEEAPAEEKEPEKEEEKAKAEPTKVEDVKPPAEGSIEAALQDDEQKPQEHTESFKEAMKDMEGGEAAGHEGHQHHELYGGKPVIIVHSEHGLKAALLWMLWFFVCVGLALLIVDLLLDAQIITTTYNIPHTNYFK